MKLKVERASLIKNLVNVIERKLVSVSEDGTKSYRVVVSHEGRFYVGSYAVLLDEQKTLMDLWEVHKDVSNTYVVLNECVPEYENHFPFRTWDFAYDAYAVNGYISKEQLLADNFISNALFLKYRFHHNDHEYVDVIIKHGKRACAVPIYFKHGVANDIGFVRETAKGIELVPVKPVHDFTYFVKP